MKYTGVNFFGDIFKGVIFLSCLISAQVFTIRAEPRVCGAIKPSTNGSAKFQTLDLKQKIVNIDSMKYELQEWDVRTGCTLTVTTCDKSEDFKHPSTCLHVSFYTNLKFTRNLSWKKFSDQIKVFQNYYAYRI